MARAGKGPRELARARRRAALQTHRRLLITMTIGYVVITGIGYSFIALAQTPMVRSLALGGMIVGYFWFMSSVLDAVDGTFSTRMGGLAEEWTSRACRRQGWYVVDHLVFARPWVFDVDHVAVGRGGVFAIETKWTAVPWRLSASGIEGAYRDPAEQAQLGAEKIGRMLRGYGLDVAVTPAVALWGPGAPHLDDPVMRVEGDGASGDLLVFEGRREREWGSALSDSDIDAGTIEAVREVLQRFVESQERAEQKRARASA